MQERVVSRARRRHGKDSAIIPHRRSERRGEVRPATKLAFASNGDGTLAIVREDGSDKFTQLESVATEFGARTMAVDEKTHRLFIPSADFAPAPPATVENPNPRRQPIPGTFQILVLDP